MWFTTTHNVGTARLLCRNGHIHIFKQYLYLIGRGNKLFHFFTFLSGTWRLLFYSQANYNFAERGWDYNLGFIFIFPQCVTSDTLTSLSGELYGAIKIKIYYFNKHKENKHFNPKAWINSFLRHYIFMNKVLLVNMKNTRLHLLFFFFFYHPTTFSVFCCKRNKV